MNTTTQTKLKLMLGAVAVSLLALTGCTANDPAPTTEPTEGADVSTLLEGKTVNFVVAYAPGGAYDRLARAIQPGFEQVSGSTVVVLNEPGAGSLLATNKTYVTPPTEYRLQLVNTVGVVAAQIAQETAEGVNYDLSEFEWIGSISNEPEIFVVPNGSPLSTLDGLKAAHQNQQAIRFGATGPGDNTWIAAFLLRDVLGFNIEIISGFANVPEVYAAMARGEIEMAVTSLASALVPINAGDGVPMLYVGDTMEGFDDVHQMISGLTEVVDFARQLGLDVQSVSNFVEPYSSLLKINRTVVAPPGTPADLLAAYRAAFDEVVSNQTLVQEQAQTGLYIKPTNGEDTRKIIEDALNAPQEFSDLLIRSFEQ